MNCMYIDSSDYSGIVVPLFYFQQVRGWGQPTNTYGMPSVNGPKTFRKRRTGLGATGKSVMTM